MSIAMNAPPQRFSFAQLEALWIQAGGSSATAPMAAAVALAESTGNPTEDVVNTGGPYPGSHDRGLWQMNSVAHSEVSNPFDPLTNARAAVRISNNGTNWRQWCSAWSNNDCSGVYLGAGSHAVAHLQQNSNVAPTTLAQLLTFEQPGGSTISGGSGGSSSSSNSLPNCAIPANVSLGIFGSTSGCLLSKDTLRHGVGIAIMLASGGIMLVSIAVIAVFSFGSGSPGLTRVANVAGRWVKGGVST